MNEDKVTIESLQNQKEINDSLCRDDIIGFQEELLFLNENYIKCLASNNALVAALENIRINYTSNGNLVRDINAVFVQYNEASKHDDNSSPLPSI